MIISDFERLVKIIKGGYNELLDPYYQGVSGQLAFFLFLSLLPIFALFSQLLAIFSLSLDTVQSWININLSDIGLSNLEGIIDDSSDISTGSVVGKIVLVILVIWSASKAQYALTGITDYINSENKAFTENYIKRRGRSFIMVILVLIILVIALAVLVYAPKILGLIFGKSKALEIAAYALVKLRWLIVLGLYFFAISLVYYLSPSKRIPYKDVLPGSMFASIGFIVVSYVYSLFITYSNSSNVIYGSLSNIVVLLAWFWFISWVIVLGIILNKLVKATRNE